MSVRASHLSNDCEEPDGALSQRKSRAGTNPALGRFAPDEKCFRLKPARALAALAADWFLIGAAFALAIGWPHPLTCLLSAIVIARTQLALAVMMHESAHGVLLPVRRLNDVIGQFLAAGPLFLSMKTYRAGHLKHHRAPMRDDDPVAVVFGIADYPISRERLAARLLADLCGVAYLASALRMVKGAYRDVLPKATKSHADIAMEIASMLLANGMLAAVLALCGHPLLYLGLWILPAITLLPFMGRIRAIMEHAGLPFCEDQSRNARTIVRPSWQTFFCGPHAIHYHIEHHLYVRVPFYHLRDVHRQLASRQLLPGSNLHAGYGSVLRRVTEQRKTAAGE